MTLLADQRLKAAAFLRSQPVYWREAALCVPAMPLLLAGGLLSGHLAFGAIAAGAAFMVGFGSARDLRRKRWAAMILATVGATIAAFVGCLAGEWTPALWAVSAAAAAGCAVLALIDEDLWWVMLQVVIALFIAGYYAGPPHAALERAGAVLAGGATQLAVVRGLAMIAPRAGRPLPPAPPKPAAPRRLMIAHALRAAVCVVLSWLAVERLGLANGYWAPMTAMLVLKPGLSETHTRGIARLTGTVVGCAAAALFVLAMGASAPWLLIAVALTAGAAFAVQKAHYALLTTAVTATVVLLLTLAHVSGILQTAEHRLIATAIGGGLALVIARIAPHRPLAAHPAMDQVGEQVGGGAA
jgi:MFS family permease